MTTAYYPTQGTTTSGSNKIKDLREHINSGTIQQMTHGQNVQRKVNSESFTYNNQSNIRNASTASSSFGEHTEDSDEFDVSDGEEPSSPSSPRILTSSQSLSVYDRDDEYASELRQPDSPRKKEGRSHSKRHRSRHGTRHKHHHRPRQSPRGDENVNIPSPKQQSPAPFTQQSSLQYSPRNSQEKHLDIPAVRAAAEALKFAAYKRAQKRLSEGASGNRLEEDHMQLARHVVNKWTRRETNKTNLARIMPEETKDEYDIASLRQNYLETLQANAVSGHPDMIFLIDSAPPTSLELFKPLANDPSCRFDSTAIPGAILECGPDELHFNSLRVYRTPNYMTLRKQEERLYGEEVVVTQAGVPSLFVKVFMNRTTFRPGELVTGRVVVNGRGLLPDFWGRGPVRAALKVAGWAADVDTSIEKTCTEKHRYQLCQVLHAEQRVIGILNPEGEDDISHSFPFSFRVPTKTPCTWTYAPRLAHDKTEGAFIFCQLYIHAGEYSSKAEPHARHSWKKRNVLTAIVPLTIVAPELDKLGLRVEPVVAERPQMAMPVSVSMDRNQYFAEDAVNITVEMPQNGNKLRTLRIRHIIEVNFLHTKYQKKWRLYEYTVPGKYLGINFEEHQQLRMYYHKVSNAVEEDMRTLKIQYLFPPTEHVVGVNNIPATFNPPTSEAFPFITLKHFMVVEMTTGFGAHNFKLAFDLLDSRSPQKKPFSADFQYQRGVLDVFCIKIGRPVSLGSVAARTIDRRPYGLRKHIGMREFEMAMNELAGAKTSLWPSVGQSILCCLGFPVGGIFIIKKKEKLALSRLQQFIGSDRFMIHGWNEMGIFFTVRLGMHKDVLCDIHVMETEKNVAKRKQTAGGLKVEDL